MEIHSEIEGYVPPREPKRWFHNGWFSRSFLLLAGLFFLLPFININCSGTKLASITGVDLLKGGEIKPIANKNSADSSSYNWGGNTSGSLFSPGGSDYIFEKGDQKMLAPNLLAIISFACIIMSLIFSFFSQRLPVIISGGLALLGALTLFFIQIQVDNAIETKIGPFNFSPIAFEFTTYYWSAIFFMALAAVFSFVRSSFLKR